MLDSLGRGQGGDEGAFLICVPEGLQGEGNSAGLHCMMYGK